MLSPAAHAVLERVKHTLANRSNFIEMSVAEIREVYASERERDAKQHAEWAAGRLVEVLRNNDRDAIQELRTASLWAIQRLGRRYLVQPAWLTHSYETALELASRKETRDA